MERDAELDSPDSPRAALLTLDDGTTLEGKYFSFSDPVAGEVVFNTGMAGYVEALTDPSYAGQILVFTYPLLGNYGVPPARPGGSIDAPYESGRVQVQAVVTQHCTESFSHHAASRSLRKWLRDEGVAGVSGIDTRSLTRRLRERGTMRGWLHPADLPADEAKAASREIDMRHEVFMRVAPEATTVLGSGAATVLLVDVGAKDNLVRSLLRRGVRVVRAPWHAHLAPLVQRADGILVGNGPGDPQDLDDLVAQIRPMLETGKPLMGVCLGNQLLARAAGATTYKLPYGHRGVNQPVQDLATRRCYITSQNHGYAVRAESLPTDWEAWFANVNDGSNEGIRARSRPHFGVQFHPEAHPGPDDTNFLFDDFVRLVHAARVP